MNNVIDKYWSEQAKELGFSVTELQDACHNSMLVWSETHRRIVDKPFSLLEYPFLEEIYMDLSKEVCIMKSAQAGASEMAVNLAFWVADTNRGNPYIVFPTATDMGTFVQGRIDTAKDETPYLNSRIKGKTDNVKLKRFGFRNMYFTGSQKRTQIISSPADLIIQDEYDEHNPDVDITVQKRANNSKLRMLRRMSTPTIPGIGIHKEYLKSSKGVWMHKCKKCKEKIRVSGEDMADRWKDLVKKVEGGYEYCCPKCKSKCDFTKGKWEHRNPKNKYIGYSINRLMTKTCSADELMKAYNDSLDNDGYDEFLRSDLGVPYEPPGSRIYDSDCVKCEDDINIAVAGVLSRKYFLGVDTGKVKHWVIGHVDAGGSIIVDNAGVVDEYGELHKLFKDFNIAMCIIDNRPEPTPVLDLHKKFHVVRGAEHTMGIVKPTSAQGKEEHVIGYSRFFSIERVYNYILGKRIAFPKLLNKNTDKKFYKHLVSQIKIERVSETTQKKVAEFRPANGKKSPDHFLFALIYMMAAYDIFKELEGNNQPSGIILLS